jgi:N-hydroxyarylamine O-acetyltransferase
MAYDSSPGFDLDAYLARIGFTGERAPTLDTLRRVQLGHATSIPFENLDPYLRRVPQLDAAALTAKLVHGGRGGWCFEQNALFRLALDALGFRTTGLAARVMWNVPAGTVTPRAHMLLLVEGEEMGEPHVADVGFGVLTPTGPLRLVAGLEQETPHERFRLAHDADSLVMQALLGDEWRTLYRFDLQPQLEPDYRVSNWYLSTNPVSHFLSTVIAARVDAEGRWTLRNESLTRRTLDGRTEQRTLASGAELRAVLEETFGIRVPDGTEVDEALERAIAPALAAAR